MRGALIEELLEGELDLIRDSLGPDSPVRVWREGTVVFVGFDSDRSGQPGLFQFGCSGYDAEAPSFAMVDPASREPLPIERWTPGVPHSVHPSTGLPFVCLQGIAEYHTHPSHLDDSWDRYRFRFRLPQTVVRLLDKAGVAK
jgi:hypothetical protein